uniref:NADH-ubiquinone oxidoreductase chain 2 n=1 Tax=Prolachesilla sp. GRAspLA TaxID=2597032 RepID=A0A8K1ZFI2_9NEOP|nr:NADH dehydrogenase subunit 2 [Prolachesilla sp. GRAspLA]
MLNNLNLMFMMMTFMSSMISISSSSWLSVWMGMEINMISFIPLMILPKNIFSNESALKYFLVQSSSSALFLMMCLLNSFFMINLMNFFTNSFLMHLMMIPLLIKLGAAPFQQWFINIIQGMSWLTCYMLMTWQKIAPIFILNYIYTKSLMIILFIFLSVLIGSIGGLSQIFLKKIMAYSSVNHLGWMFSAILISKNSLYNYIMFYLFTNAFIMMLFYMNNITQINQINSTNFMFTFFISLFSLGGLPPFLGFLPKMILIKNLIIFNKSICLLLVISSLITLFFYLRMSFKMFTIKSNSQKWTSLLMHENKWMKLYSSFIVITSMGLIFINMFLI